MLSDAEKQFLLKIARQSVESAVRKSPEIESTPSLPTLPSMEKPRGAFVTLRIENILRGCIGYVDPVKPLRETVRLASAKAALEDTRFSPILPEELPDVWIELSVLSPMERITGIEEIEIGRHGVVVDSGRLRGLLLPQVAVEYGWSRETFVGQTARKAGLSFNAWNEPGVTVSVFTAEIFSERSL
jgi:AmmeMemoRadiSam system protein A